MLIGCAYRGVFAALALTSILLFANTACAQTGPVPAEGTPSDLEREVAAVKAENAAVKEQLRRIEEQQKTLLELVDRLQQRLDVVAAAPASTSTVKPVPVYASVAPTPAPASRNALSPSIPAIIGPAIIGPLPSSSPVISDPASAATSPSSSNPAIPSLPPPRQDKSVVDKLSDYYDDGFVLVRTKEDSKFPFFLKLNNTTQFRYINTKPIHDTFADHVGTVRDVASRNDFSINRSMFTFGGYAFNPKLKFSLVTWTSNTLAAVVVGGYVGWEFSKALSIQAGYWTVPGSRTLSFTFPYFTQPDRSMADNFFRPGFTQGVWAVGEPIKGLSYHVFLGNGLNTLTIPTGKIDTHLMYSGTVFWEPLGPYGPPGKARNMYDDYYASDKPKVRIGTSYTRSREDRFSNLDQTNPENTSMHNSDGVLTFTTGAFAPGVTLQEALYRMWAIDGGVKWRGLAVNGQYYFRWLTDFKADGLLPISSTLDHGAELSASHFFIPKKLMLYGRTSFIRGQFRDSYEFGGGLKWYFVDDHRVWLQGEALRITKSPFGGILYPYTAGMSGWAPHVQLIFNF